MVFIDKFFIDKWSLFGCYFFNFINKGLLKCGRLCLQVGLYSEVVFNIGFTVYTIIELQTWKQKIKGFPCGIFMKLIINLNKNS